MSLPPCRSKFLSPAALVFFGVACTRQAPADPWPQVELAPAEHPAYDCAGSDGVAFAVFSPAADRSVGVHLTTVAADGAVATWSGGDLGSLPTCEGLVEAPPGRFTLLAVHRGGLTTWRFGAGFAAAPVVDTAPLPEWTRNRDISLSCEAAATGTEVVAAIVGERMVGEPSREMFSEVLVRLPDGSWDTDFRLDPVRVSSDGDHVVLYRESLGPPLGVGTWIVAPGTSGERRTEMGGTPFADALKNASRKLSGPPAPWCDEICEERLLLRGIAVDHGQFARLWSAYGVLGVDGVGADGSAFSIPIPILDEAMTPYEKRLVSTGDGFTVELGYRGLEWRELGWRAEVPRTPGGEVALRLTPPGVQDPFLDAVFPESGEGWMDYMPPYREGYTFCGFGAHGPNAIASHQTAGGVDEVSVLLDGAHIVTVPMTP